MARQLLFIQPDDEPNVTVGVDLESIIWSRFTEPLPDNPQAKHHLQVALTSGKEWGFTGLSAKSLNDILVKRRQEKS
jgi:hypothetical protein